MLASSVNPSDLKAVLQKHIDRIITVTFSDGIVCKVKPLTVDDEGFVYDIEAAPGEVPLAGSPFWTRFEDIARIEQTMEES